MGEERECRRVLKEDCDKQANETDVLCLTNKDLVERLKKVRGKGKDQD